MKRTIFLLLWMLLPGLVFAQEGPPVEQLNAMKKVDFLVGHWEGDGWMAYGPGQRTTFKSMETVERKLDGVVLLVEGIHMRATEGGEEQIIHHALALISYDTRAGHYSFRSQLASGRGGNFTGSVNEAGAFVWGMDAGGRQIRYTIMLNEAGEWHEVGEMSQDGQQWNQFFEMTLRRTD